MLVVPHLHVVVVVVTVVVAAAAAAAAVSPVSAVVCATATDQ